MFENAELGHAVDKDTYRAEEPKVRTELLQAQHELAASDLGVIVLVAGMEAAGKSETVNHLLGWLDARGVQTHALGRPTGEEKQRPPMWRYWRRLPPRGQMAVFFGAWDADSLLDAAFGRLSERWLDRALDRAVAFERMLAEERVLLTKFWLHLSKPAQKRRLKALEGDPLQSWRVTKDAWKQYKHYAEIRRVAEHIVSRTDSAEAPWHIVEAEDKRYRHLTVAGELLGALRGAPDRLKAEPPPPPPAPVRLTPPAVNVINQLDLSVSLTKKDYDKQLPEAQAELNALVRRMRKAKRSLTLVFEGSDAAGKGGTIRRLTEALDARDYRVMSVAAPTDEERAHPYLWRFWRQVPRRGKVTIYDRSWYGRVLVERVEGLCRPSDWQRAYSEINDFEAQLTEAGVVVVKFWLAISPEEQLRRFERREETPYKQYKITEEDWRNRDRWDSYIGAACEMIERTSTGQAPWVLVEAENKEWARVKVAQEVVRRLGAALGE